MSNVFDAVDAGPEVPVSTTVSTPAPRAEVIDVDLDPTRPPDLRRTAMPWGYKAPAAPSTEEVMAGLRSGIAVTVKVVTVIFGLLLTPLALVAMLVTAVVGWARIGFTAAPAWGQHVITACVSGAIGALIMWLVG